MWSNFGKKRIGLILFGMGHYLFGDLSQKKYLQTPIKFSKKSSFKLQPGKLRKM